MLNNKMTLKQMIDFIPSENDMLSLPLDDVVYMRVTTISFSKEDNYNFIKFLYKDEEIHNYVNNINGTIFYDFDGTHTDKEKFITIFELTSKITYHELSLYLEELLNKYTHEADVLIDLFTHDSKSYRLSNLEAVVKLEEMNIKK